MRLGVTSTNWPWNSGSRDGTAPCASPVLAERGGGDRSYTVRVSTEDPQQPSGPSPLPSGSVVPGADIWEDDDDWEPTRVETTWREVTGEDSSWLVEAQVVVHPEDKLRLVGDVPPGEDADVGIELDDDDEREGFGTKLNRWSRTSMMGATLSGIGIGLQKVLNPQDQVQIEIEADADDDDHLDPVKVTLDHEQPDRSVAVLRPWLSEGGGSSRPSHPSSSSD